MAVETRLLSRVGPMRIYEDGKVRAKKILLNWREMAVPKISHADFGGRIEIFDWFGGRKC